MNREKTKMEARIKRELNVLYKAAFGKGPETTETMIYENFVFLKFCSAFSPIEESLLKSEPGRDIVGQIRDELILHQTALYTPTLEEIVQEKVSKINYMLDEKNKCVYIFILFANPINLV